MRRDDVRYPGCRAWSLTASIAEAFVSNNQVGVTDVGDLINKVHETLVKLGEPAAPEEPRATPAVSIRASVKHDHLICFECGRKMTMIKRHLGTDHQMSVEDYRAKFSLPRDYPTVAPTYAARRADLAKQIGLGRKPAAPAATPTKAPTRAPKEAPKAHGRKAAVVKETAPVVEPAAPKPKSVKVSATKTSPAKASVVTSSVPDAAPAPTPAKRPRKAPAKA